MDRLRIETVTELSRALHEAKSAGLSQDDLRKCLELENSEANTESESSFRRRIHLYLHFCVFTLLPVLLSLSLLYLPLSALLRGSWCLVPQIFPFPEVLRPIADCSVCGNVSTAPRLTNLSRHDFVRQYAYNSKPILVVGAALEWPAVSVFSYEYFRELYLNTPEAIESDTSSGQFFSYSSAIKSLRQLFELPRERASMATEKWYIGWYVQRHRIALQIVHAYTYLSRML